MIRREYDFNLTKEENLALLIYDTLHNNFGDTITNKEFLNNFHFEIVNDFYHKNVFFSYVLNPQTKTNIENIEICLMRIGIEKKFIDKSSDGKKYLAVWKVKKR